MGNEKPYLVPIIMGSPSDWKEHTERIAKELEGFGIPYEVRVFSAHRNPRELLDVIDEYDTKSQKDIVYITVAGLSNGLSGVVAGATRFPVIACPPKASDDPTIDYASSYRMPPGITVAFIPDPKNAAFHAAKILRMTYGEHLKTTIEKVLEEGREKVRKADKEKTYMPK